MKHVIYLFPFIFLSWNTVTGQAEELPPLVVASTSVFADMAEVVGGNMIRVQSVVPIGRDPHTYEPTPEDVFLIAHADLILVNGLGLDDWMNKLVENSNTNAETVTVSKGINLIQSEELPNSSDPHAWMSAKNGMIYVANVRDALSRLDPENTQAYHFNTNMYLAQIQDLDTYIQGELERIPKAQRILITGHNAFRYYGLHYGVQQITEDNKVTIGGVLHTDSLGELADVAGTYLKLLRYNTDMIVSGLLGDTEKVGPHQYTNQIKLTSLLRIVLPIMVGALVFVLWRLNRGLMD